MNQPIRNFLCLVAFAAFAFGQSPISSTTLSTSQTSSTTVACLASATNVVTPSLSGAQAGGSILLINREAEVVQSATLSSTCFNVKRGQYPNSYGNGAVAHGSSAKVWILQPVVSSGDTSRPVTAAQFLSNRPYDENQQFMTPPLSGVVAFGTVTDVAGKTWFDALDVQFNSIATGACIANGSTVTTDKWIVALYDHAGNLMANSALAGTTTAGVSTFQCIAFTSPIAVFGPDQYFLALQGNGTTDTFKAYGTGGAMTSYPTGSVTGTFATLPTLTVTSTFTASVGPVMTLY
jgi:hypothetical protein